MVHSPKDYFNVTIVFTIGFAIAYACSFGALSYSGLPVIVCCMLVSFLVHWIAFIPSYAFRTEKYYDICGTLAYVLVLLTAICLTTSASESSLHTRSILVIALVLIWAFRLGFFLFIRVLKAGEDRRFREVKQKFSGFLVWWTLSALWVFLTTVNALVMIINNVSYYNDYYFYFGWPN